MASPETPAASTTHPLLTTSPVTDTPPVEAYRVYRSRQHRRGASAGTTGDDDDASASRATATPTTAISRPIVTAPPSEPAAATESLLFQSLRGDAQALGLTGQSIGWAMIHALGTQQGPAWANLRHILSQAGQVTLLLPKTCIVPSTLGELCDDGVTVDGILDHCLVGKVAVPQLERDFVTLGGWRGVLGGDQLVITSVGRRLDLTAAVRAGSDWDYSAITPASGPATSLFGELTNSLSLRYPAFAFAPSATVLNIASLRSPVPPIHPSRADRRAVPTPGSTTAKLASLFSTRSIDSSAPISRSSTAPTPAEPIQTFSLQSAILDQPLDRALVSGQLRLTLTAKVKHALESLDHPNVVQAVIDAVLRFVPDNTEKKPTSPIFGLRLVSEPSIVDSEAASVTGGLRDIATSVDNLALASADDMSIAIQTLYDDVEKLIYDDQEDDDSKAVESALETIEELVCGELLYDHLLRPSTSDDRDMDEKIAGRIAGLNLVDLTLDHLGLDLENHQLYQPEDAEALRDGLQDILESVQQELGRLQDVECKSPGEKLGVFVNVHKIIVDGLSNLPPIPMKQETSDQRNSTRPPNAEVEMTSTRPSSIHSQEGSDPPNVKQTTSSADVILPLLIFSIVKSNPIKLTSHLKFVQRFKCSTLIHGESAYCLVNVEAVCEFLRTVDTTKLLQPFESTTTTTTSTKQPVEKLSMFSRSRTTSVNREKLVTEVDQAVTTASRVVSGVFENYQRLLNEAIDSSTKLVLGTSNDKSPKTLDDVKNMLSGQAKDAGISFGKARAGLLRRATGSFQVNKNEVGKELVNVGSSGKKDDVLPTSTLETVPFESHSTSRFTGLTSLSRFSSSSPNKESPLKSDSGKNPLLTAIVGHRTKPATTKLSTTPKTEIESILSSVQVPIDRFVNCKSIDQLKLGDVSDLLTDYQRLAQLILQLQAVSSSTSS